MTTRSGRPRLYLHIGPAKTGTSAIQNVLRKHDDSVVIYPKVGLWPDGSHHNLVFNFYRIFARPDAERLDLNSALAEIGDGARRSGNSVVVSSEALFGQDLRPFLDALLRAIHARPDEAEILVVHREPYARAASAYNQSVKDSQYSERRPPGKWLRHSAEGLIYAPFLEQIAALDVPVRLIAYDPGADFVARFLAHIGFPAEQIPPREARNVSLSVKGLIATLAANRIATSRAHRDLLFEAIRRQRGFYAPSRFLFDAESVRAVEPIFAADRQTLETRWGFATPALDPAKARDEFWLTDAEAADIDAACQTLDPADRDAMRDAVARFVQTR